MSAQSHAGSIINSSLPPSLQLLTPLPPNLLALVASHLPLVTLLRLQRCSSAHYSLRTDDAFVSVAWCWAELHLSLTLKLHVWALRYTQCIADSDHCGPRLIPVTVWQAALPAFRAVLAKADEADERYQQLRELMRQPLRTTWTLAQCDTSGVWHTVSDETSKHSTDVRRVEVLRDIERHYLSDEVHEAVPSGHEMEVHAQLVLQACPYLQHLTLTTDPRAYVQPNEDHTLTLVPCLRSLRLQHHLGESSELSPSIDVEQMLDGLPHLTSLHCIDTEQVGVSELIDIAAHSTLQDVRFCSGELTADEEWIGTRIQFPINVEADEIQLEADATRLTFDGDIEEESDQAAQVGRVNLTDSQLLASTASEENEPAWVRDEMQRINKALTRTEPTQRSCEVRLALADWLHRRLRRGKLRTDDHSTNATHPKRLLRSCRKHVALLRCMLRRQLSELKEATVSAAQASETVQLERLQRFDRQLAKHTFDRSQVVHWLWYNSELVQHYRQRADERSAQAKEPDMFERSDEAVNVEYAESRVMELRQKLTALELRTKWLEKQRDVLQAAVEDIAVTAQRLSCKSADKVLLEQEQNRPSKRARIHD